MADSIVIQSIEPERMVVVLNLGDQTWQKSLPFLDTHDAGKLTTQLQGVAQEMRDELGALKASVQAEQVTSTPQVADEVNALIGQEIPIDGGAPGGVTGV